MKRAPPHPPLPLITGDVVHDGGRITIPTGVSALSSELTNMKCKAVLLVT